MHVLFSYAIFKQWKRNKRWTEEEDRRVFNWKWKKKKKKEWSQLTSLRRGVGASGATRNSLLCVTQLLPEKERGTEGKKKERKKRERRYWFPGVSGLPWRADLCRSESGNQLLRTLTGRPRMSHSFLVQEKKVARVRGMPTHPRKPPPPPRHGTACQLFSAFQSALGAGQTKQCVDKVQGWGKTTKEGLFSCTHTER